MVTTQLEQSYKDEIKLLNERNNILESEIKRLKNLGPKWSRDWNEMMDKPDGKSLQEIVESLEHRELVELIAFKAISFIEFSLKEGIYYKSEKILPEKFINFIQDIIRAQEALMEKQGRTSLFQGLGRLAWNDVRKALIEKHEALEKERLEAKARIDARRKEREENSVIESEG